MDKILSQDEINALFSAMATEELPLAPAAEPPKDNRKINAYDFRRANGTTEIRTSFAFTASAST